jgi:H+/Cl- antiporter ClcA
VLAAAMQGPLSAVVLMLELAHTQELLVPVLLAVTGATAVSRMLGAPSLYSARLGEAGAAPRPGVRQVLDELEEEPPAPGA